MEWGETLEKVGIVKNSACLCGERERERENARIRALRKPK